MTILDVETFLLIVMPAFPILTTIILIRYARRAESPSLRERTLLAVRDSLVAISAAVLAMQRLGIIELPEGVPVLMLATLMLLVSLPSAYWLWLYFRGGFR